MTEKMITFIRHLLVAWVILYAYSILFVLPLEYLWFEGPLFLFTIFSASTLWVPAPVSLLHLNFTGFRQRGWAKWRFARMCEYFGVQQVSLYIYPFEFRQTNIGESGKTIYGRTLGEMVYNVETGGRCVRLWAHGVEERVLKHELIHYLRSLKYGPRMWDSEEEKAQEEVATRRMEKWSWPRLYQWYHGK